jgi:hypothetical protein
MNAARYVFVASMAAAVTIAACSDAGPLSPEKSPPAFAGIGDSSGGGRGGGGNGQGSGGGGGDTAHGPPPDSSHPPKPAPWPRTVIGYVQGLTFINGGGSDTMNIEKVAGATVQLYKAQIPQPPNYDSLPPTLYGSTKTNSDGVFTFADLPEAGYMLKVTPPAGSPYKEATMWFTPQASVWKIAINLYRQ